MRIQGDGVRRWSASSAQPLGSGSETHTCSAGRRYWAGNPGRCRRDSRGLGGLELRCEAGRVAWRRRALGVIGPKPPTGPTRLSARPTRLSARTVPTPEALVPVLLHYATTRHPVGSTAAVLATPITYRCGPWLWPSMTSWAGTNQCLAARSRNERRLQWGGAPAYDGLVVVGLGPGRNTG
jgi:hypothetical protein